MIGKLLSMMHVCLKTGIAESRGTDLTCLKALKEPTLDCDVTKIVGVLFLPS